MTVVRYRPKRAVYDTLEGQCLHTGTLPSLAYGGKSCSLKYKRGPQDLEIIAHFPPAEIVKRGKRIVRAIGFEAGEERRTYAHTVKAIGLDAGEEHRLTWAKSKPGQKKRLSREAWLDQNFFFYWYPLMEWGFNRERCKQIIASAGIDIDSYDFGTTRHTYRCQSCGAELEQVIPIIAISGHWLWCLKQSWFQQMMRKANAFDPQQANESEAET